MCTDKGRHKECVPFGKEANLCQVGVQLCTCSLEKTADHMFSAS